MVGVAALCGHTVNQGPFYQVSSSWYGEYDCHYHDDDDDDVHDEGIAADGDYCATYEIMVMTMTISLSLRLCACLFICLRWDCCLSNVL